MIIAISDLHLGDELSNKGGFVEFIDEYLKPNRNEITDLVLLGDILDLWRRDNSQLILQNMKLLSDISSLGFHVSYIVGNHDMIMSEFHGNHTVVNIPQAISFNSNNLTICRSHIQSNGNSNYRFIHGHQINYWFALPFYETFSKAMCHHYGIQSEIVNVWSLMERYSNTISPWLLSRIRQLSKKQQEGIENRLAGPLGGPGISEVESMKLDLDLLQNFIEFHSPDSEREQQHMIDSIRKEVKDPFWDSIKDARIESWDEFIEIIENGTIMECASRFLLAWSDVLHWNAMTNSMVKSVEQNQLIHRAMRIAAIFSGVLNHDEFLVRGHGHIPYVDLQSRVADTGCWLDSRATFISIDDGTIVCNDWPK